MQLGSLRPNMASTFGTIVMTYCEFIQIGHKGPCIYVLLALLQDLGLQQEFPKDLHWAPILKNSPVLLHCGNMAAVYTLTYFRAGCPELSARNIRSLLIKYNNA